MDIQNLKSAAAEHLTAAPYHPRRLALIHSGAAVLLSLLLTLVNFLLTRQMDNTGGLAGISTRTVLYCIQSVITLAGGVAIPFWDFGFYRAALNISRDEPAVPATLLTGFRRFGPVLRLLLLRALLSGAIMFLCLQAAVFLYMLSPLSFSFIEQAEKLLLANPQATIESLLPFLIPVYVIAGVLVCIVLIPLLYRIRLADFMVIDDTPGVLQAMKESSRCTYRKRLALFRLDLHFWWFHGLSLLAVAVSYGDVLLSALGVAINGDVALFVFGILSSGIQLLVAWRFVPGVYTTYAMAYNTLRTQKAPPHPSLQAKPF